MNLLMFLVPLLASMVIGVFLLTLFFLFSKSYSWENLNSSVFECGFTSWFFSRFSFSIHYFTIGLIFLFLDLELCLMLPLLSSSLSSLDYLVNFLIFLSALGLGLMIEWKEEKLSWSF